MEQGGDGRGVGGERDMNHQHQPHDQGLNEMQQGGGRQQAHIQPQRPQQPQQCPRCNSMDTKFCYYNNYNVTQPRHYCKTCRRYWTQGGTLRNIPVGGGCRKRKHVENSSSSWSQPLPPQEVVVQRHQPQPPRPQDVVVQTQQQPNITTMAKATNPCLGVDLSTSPFYQGGGGYLSSMHAIHLMNQSQSSHYEQSLKIGSDAAGSSSSSSSNLGLASGFNVGSLTSQCQIQPSHIYQMGGREREVQSQYTPQQGFIIPSSMTTIHTSVPSHTDWPQGFINDANNRTCDASLWSNISNSSTSIRGNIERSDNVVGSSPLIPNPWSNFPGYGPPPSSY